MWFAALSTAEHNPWFVSFIKKILDGLFLESYSEYDIEKDGLKIYTTLDIKLQKSAQKATKKQLSKMQIKLDADGSNSRFWTCA